jgi:hypothetical protein
MPAGPQTRGSHSTIGRDRCHAEVFRVVSVGRYASRRRFAYTDIQGLSDGAARGLGDGYRTPEELDIT